MLVDAIVLPIALWSAFALRLGEFNPDVTPHWPAFIACVVVALPLFVGLGLYRQVVRYMGYHAMAAVLIGALLTSIVIGFLAWTIPLVGFPRSVPIIFWLLTMLYVSGTRFAVRAYVHQVRNRVAPREPVIIFGAGSKGVELARLLRQQGSFEPIAFLDGDKKLQRSSIDGIYVYSERALSKLLRESTVKQVLVAVGDHAVRRREVIEFLEPYSVRVRLIPDIEELVSGRATLANLRDVGIEDLLGRDEVEALPHLLEGSVAERAVLVTGAGGSIGSELCRQILRRRPKLLVLPIIWLTRSK